MKRVIWLSIVLLAGCAADGRNNNAAIGGAVGGAAGAAVGYEIGGQTGAIIGGAVGGAAGAAVGGNQDAAPRHQTDRYPPQSRGRSEDAQDSGDDEHERRHKKKHGEYD